MRTIFHKSAMLVVVWYAHLTWKLEFDSFLFQYKSFCKSLPKLIFCPNQDPSLFCWGTNAESFFLVGNRNRMRTIFHKSAMLVVVCTSNLKIGIWLFSFPIKNLYVKVFKKWFFVQIKTRAFFVGEPIPERFFLVGNRNRMRTIFHKSAVLVVVWYAHLTWKLEFDSFLFQLKIFM